MVFETREGRRQFPVDFPFNYVMNSSKIKTKNIVVFRGNILKSSIQ